jgi:hypothetical protein
MYGAVVDAIGQGRAPVNAAVVELADRIERGELQPDPTNVELLGALASESG